MTNQVKTYANHKFRFRLNECIRRCEKMIEFRRRNTPNPKRPSEWSECSPNEHQKKNVIRKRWLFQAILSFTCVEYPNREASERIVQRIMLLISVLKISSRAPSRRRIQSRIQKKKRNPLNSFTYRRSTHWARTKRAIEHRINGSWYSNRDAFTSSSSSSESLRFEFIGFLMEVIVLPHRSNLLLMNKIL